tara:strand:- start:644 stop:916 length:273 start_codon:yes stop_codon:yes gene_type:complete
MKKLLYIVSFVAVSLSLEAVDRALLKSAKSGNVEDRYKVAIAYYKDGSEKNFLKWCKEAANGGHIKGQYNLGVLYEKGSIVKEDTATAIT